MLLYYTRRTGAEPLESRMPALPNPCVLKCEAYILIKEHILLCEQILFRTLSSPRLYALCRLRIAVWSTIAALVLNENLIIYNRRRVLPIDIERSLYINTRVSVWVCLLFIYNAISSAAAKRHVPLFTARAATCRRTSPWLRSSLAAFCLICGRRRLIGAWRIKKHKTCARSPRTCCDFALSLWTRAVDSNQPRLTVRNFPSLNSIVKPRNYVWMMYFKNHIIITLSLLRITCKRQISKIKIFNWKYILLLRNYDGIPHIK